VLVPTYNLAGSATGEIEISDYVFGQPLNEAVVHQALLRQQANARQGTAATKTRGEIAGSTRKLFRQKHTGQARAGSRRSPIRRGGGVVFGPHPRSYRQAMPRKMRHLALRCVLSAKAGDGELKVMEDLVVSGPKTKEMVQIIRALGAGTSTLIVAEGDVDNIVKSARNLEGVKVTAAPLINVVDLLSCRTLLMTVAAVRRVEELWGEKKEGANAPV
jgi:large subunit ribosomal protein L4